MKKVLLIVSGLFFAGISQAQFSKAKLQATGLTCAMCSNAINKALQKVSFVTSVEPDIKNSAFLISFRENQPVNIDALKDAVEDAGFSVGSLELTGSFSGLKISDDDHIRIGKDNFHFIHVGDRVLNGEVTFRVLDKNFVTAKAFKKFSSSTKMPCIQSGKTASCCARDGMAAGERIYHVTI
jgi:copper chaperone CopZ